MGRIVIVGYKPKSGKEEQLETLTKNHLPLLRKEGLATERDSVIMRSKTGIVIEVFELKSTDAIKSAHTNSTVQRMWKEFAKCCNYVPVSEIEEAKELFSDFTPIEP